MLHIAQGTLVVFILLMILFYLRTERSYLYLVLNVLSYTVVVNYTNYQNTRYNHYKILITSDDLTTIYLWGYSYQYPVAEIRNASWEQVESIIGDAEAFAAAEIPDGMLLARLRTELPSAQVTVYTYEPLVGITSSTDPRGHTTYYEYDDVGRLVRVKEGEKTTTLYKYHYRNE